MRKGIGPRGLGAVKSPAKQTKNHSMRYQKHLEAGIRDKYGKQLSDKEKEIRTRTYKESGITDWEGPRKGPAYDKALNVANTRVTKRMMNNKGPQEIRAKRDAEISASRATYEAMPSTQSRKRSAIKQVAKGHEGQTKKKKYDGKITNIEKRKGQPGYTVTVRGSVNPENLKHALKHGKGKRAMKK